MCSWRFLPACITKMTWSTPASSKRGRYSRICSGVPVAPRSPVVSPAATLAPSRSWLQRGLDLGRVAPLGPPLDELLPTRRSCPARGRRRCSSGRASSRRSCRPRARGRAPPPRSGCAHHRRDAGDVGVDGLADGHAPLGQRASRSRATQCTASSGSMKAKVSDPMPFSAASRIVSRREQATHSGGCGFCTGFGHDVARRHGDELAVDAGERRLGHAPERRPRAPRATPRAW